MKDQRVQSVRGLATGRIDWERLTRGLARVLPNDVWLTSLTGSVPLDSTTGTTAPTASTPLPAAPTALSIEGYTYSQASVARLLARLEVLPDLKNVQLTNSEVSQLGGRDVYQFTIVSDVRKGRGAS